jgi:hypothetical protein
MRDNNVTPAGMVSVAGNLMMGRSIYGTKRQSPSAPNREAPEPRGKEPQAAEPSKMSSQHGSAGRELELLASSRPGATLLVG